MNNKLNTLMAEMMGWVLNTTFEQHFYIETVSPANFKYHNVEDWHPDTDMTQALMCAEKFIEDTACHFEIQLFLEDDGRVGYTLDICACLRDDIEPVVMTNYINNQSLSSAICEAILEAVEE